jgi:hypothetical protein
LSHHLLFQAHPRSSKANFNNLITVDIPGRLCRIISVASILAAAIAASERAIMADTERSIDAWYESVHARRVDVSFLNMPVNHS